jgi:esterase/lipase superfamily enzyme
MTPLDDVVFLELLRDHLDEIRAALGVHWPDFIRAVRPLLLQVAEAKDPTQSTKFVDEMLERLLKTSAEDTIQRLLLQARKHPQLRAVRTGDTPVEMLAVPENVQNAAAATAAAVSEWITPTDEFRYRSVPVFFATDRATSGLASPNQAFGSERGTLSFGEVRVSIPERHVTGHIERPLPLFQESPEKHVTLLGLRQTDGRDFVSDLTQAIELAPAPRLLVFVHGYRVTFAEGARVVAQIVSDINFTGIPVLYSWPSKGRFLGYVQDEADAAWTREDFLKTLDMLADLRIGKLKTSADQSLMAHSMGNRIVFQGLQLLQGMRYGNVILAAPDEDAGTLQNQMPRFLGHAERTTVYASKKDFALKFSAWLHGYKRVGQSGVTGVDSIDASAVNFSRFGHSYFSDQRALLTDISLLLELGLPPNKRPLMRRASDGIGWHFQP